MIRFMRWTFPGLLIAGGILAGIPAAAQASSTLVYFNDLDISSPYGLATLQQRIERAVTIVCGRDSAGQPLHITHNIQRCRAGARSNAELQLAFMANQTRRLAAREGAVVIASR